MLIPRAAILGKDVEIEGEMNRKRKKKESRCAPEWLREPTAPLQVPAFFNSLGWLADFCCSLGECELRISG